MADYEEIIDFIGKFSYIFTDSDYIQTQLRKKTTLSLVSRIIDESNKKPGEVLVLFLTAIKYLWGNKNVFTALEESDSFQEFVKANQDTIIEMSIQKTLQANLPERSLPLFEIFNKKIERFPIAIIELGASYGLIGQCLLGPAGIIEKKDRYFLPGQKIPQNPRAVDYYLGIELQPPEKKWLFACVWKPEDELRLKNFINDIPREEKKFQLIEASAFGFSALKPVKKLTELPLTIVVLTSFLFFQIGKEEQKQLRNEILKFIESTGSHWINQVFIPSPVSMDKDKDKDNEYFIEWDGKKIIELLDDWCSDWRWVQ